MTRRCGPGAPARAAAAALALLASAAPASAELGRAFRAAMDASGALVVVDYVLEREGHGFGAVGQRGELATAGTIVSADGLLVVPDNIYLEEEDARNPARPHTFLARLPDGSRIPCEEVGRAEGAGIAFLRLAPATPRTFPRVEFFAARPAVGDRLVIVSLLPEKFGFQPSYTPATVAAVLAGPRHQLDLDVHLQETSLGLPAFDAAGRAVGLMGTDPFGTAGPGALAATLELIGTISRGKEPGFPVVLGASGFVDAIRNPPRAEGAAGRAWLGVTLQPVDRALATYLAVPDPTGIMVTSVWKGSPADAAGLRPEDIIRRFDGRDVVAATEESVPPFIDAVQGTEAGRDVEIEILRGGQAMTVRLAMGTAPTSAGKAAEHRNRAFGLVVQELTIDVIMNRAWPPDTSGALVTEVERAGWAQVGGIEPGDLVLAVDGRPVASIADLETSLAAAADRKAREVVFFVLRDPDTLFVPVKTAW